MTINVAQLGAVEEGILSDILQRRWETDASQVAAFLEDAPFNAFEAVGQNHFGQHGVSAE